MLKAVKQVRLQPWSLGCCVGCKLEVRKMARSPGDSTCSRWVGLCMLWCCEVLIFDLFLPEVSLFFGGGEDWEMYYKRNGWDQYWIGILGIRDVSTRKMFGRKKYQLGHGDCYSNQIGLPPLICGASTRKIYIFNDDLCQKPWVFHWIETPRSWQFTVVKVLWWKNCYRTGWDSIS